MNNEEQQIEALKDIRRMMRESSRFLSLSGLSGILAGIYALAGAWFVHQTIRNDSSYSHSEKVPDQPSYLVMKIVFTCCAVLFLTILTVLYLSYLKAKKNNHKLLDHSSKKLLWSMMVPLTAGGIFCIALLMHDKVLLIAPAMLIFYALSLISSSRFTLDDVRYLGYLELIVGLTACFYPGHGLLFWALGFGALHIVYGSIMWYKYDRNQ